MLDVIEALYDLESTRAEWLHTIARRCADIFGRRHVGSYALEYDASDITDARFSRPTMYDVKNETAADLLCRDIPIFYRKNPSIVDAVFRHVGFGSSEVLPRTEGMFELVAKLSRAGVKDILGINGVNVDGRSIHAGVLLPFKLSNVDEDTLARVSSHFAASARLRRRLKGKRKAEEADAIVDDRGNVAHARGKAKAARAQIAEAAATLARVRRSRRDPERAVAQWKALVDARWSLVDHFERDGKHFVLAERNDPAIGAFSLLTERELQVVALASLGNSNKMIAYELGISVSTVGVLFARAAQRLGVRTRKQLIAAYLASQSA